MNVFCDATCNTELHTFLYGLLSQASKEETTVHCWRDDLNY